MRSLIIAALLPLGACAAAHPERATLSVTPLPAGCVEIARQPGPEGGLAIPRQAVCPIAAGVSPAP